MKITLIVLLYCVTNNFCVQAACSYDRIPPGYYGDGKGSVSVICGCDINAGEGSSTSCLQNGRVDGIALSRGQARHITSLPVGTTDVYLRVEATGDVDTLLMKNCGSTSCPYTSGTNPNYGTCMAGYSCENYCGWSSSGCTRSAYGGSWSFSGDCIRNCYSGTYHVKEWVRVPEVTSSMGELEYYVYAYSDFNGNVEYSYTAAQTCNDDSSCKSCDAYTNKEADICGANPNVNAYAYCDNTNQIKCGCPDNPSTGTGTSLKSVNPTCENSEIGVACTTFECNDGYAKTGTNPTCESGGTWTGLTTSCEALRCENDPSPVANIDNSRTFCERTTIGGTCTLTCLEGYSPSGTPTCSAGTGATVQWNTGSLSCIANSCSSSSPTSIFNVINAQCSTSSGSECSAYSGTGSRTNTYDCASGYDPSGTARCTTGTWIDGSCVPGSCKSAPSFEQFLSIDDVTLACNLANVPSGQSCDFTCNSGFDASGTLACTNEVWSGSASCVPSPCRSSPGITDEISNTCVDTASGETCIFECATTHYTVGSVTCDHGSFVLSTSPAAECKLIEQCGVPSVENGQYDPTGWESAQNGDDLDATMISCNPGYEKIDPSPTPECVCPAESTDPCQTLTNWCSEISCGANIVTGGGTVSSANCPAQTGSAAFAINRPTCAFSCDDGFYIDAVTNEKECNIDGTWPTGPACAEYVCEAIIVTASQEQAGASCDATGASSQPTCEYECQDGWEIVGGSGNRFASCDYYGVWSPAPACQRSSCTPYEVPNSVGGPVNGVTDDIVEVVCAQGYYGPSDLGNNQTGDGITCQADGNFTSFTCEASACEPYRIPLSNYDMDHMTGVTGVTGDVVTVECPAPFSTGTSTTTTCQNTGVFTSVTCEEVGICARGMGEVGSESDPNYISTGLGWLAEGDTLNCTSPTDTIGGAYSCGVVQYHTGKPTVVACYACKINSNCIVVGGVPECVIYNDDCPDPSLASNVTDAPVTDAPVTDAPVTDAPVTDAPVTDAPVTDAPVTDAPVTDAAVTDAPVTDAPVTDAPVTDAPVTDAPVTEATITDAPVTEGTEVESFDVVVNLQNMDDTYVNANLDGVLNAISTGVCAHLSTIDNDAICVGSSLLRDTSTRRRLADGEWIATVSVTSYSNSKRDACITHVNDASLEDDLASSISSALTAASHGDAVDDGSLVTIDGAVAVDNSPENDEDTSSSFPIAIVAGAVGGLIAIIALVAMVFLCRQNKREFAISSSNSGTNMRTASGDPIAQGLRSDIIFEGPGPDDL